MLAITTTDLAIRYWEELIDLTDIRALIWSSCNIDILIVTMKKDFIVARIEASQDGSPYVYVAFGDPNDYKPGGERQEQNPFGSNVMAFTSPEDLMKNLPKAMGNISKMMGGGAAASLIRLHLKSA